MDVLSSPLLMLQTESSLMTRSNKIMVLRCRHWFLVGSFPVQSFCKNELVGFVAFTVAWKGLLHKVGTCKWMNWKGVVGLFSRMKISLLHPDFPQSKGLVLFLFIFRHSHPFATPILSLYSELGNLEWRWGISVDWVQREFYQC